MTVCTYENTNKSFMLGNPADSTTSNAKVDFHARSSDSLMPFDRSKMTLWLLRSMACGIVSAISQTTTSLNDAFKLLILPKVRWISLSYSTSKWPLNNTTISPFFCASEILRDACSLFCILPKLTMFIFRFFKVRAT